MYYNLSMREIDVEWDDVKNEANKREHEGLGFDLAQLVFADPNRLERLDQSDGNVSGEVRWQTLGMVGKVLFAVYTERGGKKTNHFGTPGQQGRKEKLPWELSDRR